ncbi:uncharacterized protein LOC124201640 [Daphnia pulex]|uniref:uncharacterized protein LOC124201640 n=1 Tax=Daphnia pulex TaxID=6669 RepID=UPI001EDD9E20|nr:uncharacterized protein LOC124201640 [Daphnia pulex]
MACRMKRFWCDCSLQTATKFIGSVDMLVNVTIGVLLSSRTVVNGPNDIMYATATFAFVLVMFSILLIYAARCRRHQLVLPWLIVQLLERCFIAVFIAVGLVRHALGVVPIILILFALIFAFYLWWVVGCFYLELTDEERADVTRTDSQSRELEHEENA